MLVDLSQTIVCALCLSPIQVGAVLYIVERSGTVGEASDSIKRTHVSILCCYVGPTANSFTLCCWSPCSFTDKYLA